MWKHKVHMTGSHESSDTEAPFMPEENRSEVIKIRVTPSELETINEFVEEDGRVSNRSDYFRIAARQFRNDDMQSGGGGASIDQIQTVISDVLEQELDEVTDRLAEVEDRIEAMESGRIALEDEEELAIQVAESLPLVDQPKKILPGFLIGGRDPDQVPAETLPTIQDVADEFGTPYPIAKEALEQAEEWFPQVDCRNFDTDRWFRTGEV